MRIEQRQHAQLERKRAKKYHLVRFVGRFNLRFPNTIFKPRLLERQKVERKIKQLQNALEKIKESNEKVKLLEQRNLQQKCL